MKVGLYCFVQRVLDKIQKANYTRQEIFNIIQRTYNFGEFRIEINRYQIIIVTRLHKHRSKSHKESLNR